MPDELIRMKPVLPLLTIFLWIYPVVFRMRLRYLAKRLREGPKQPTLHRDVQLTLNLQTQLVADAGERPREILVSKVSPA